MGQISTARRCLWLYRRFFDDDDPAAEGLVAAGDSFIEMVYQRVESTWKYRVHNMCMLWDSGPSLLGEISL